MSLKNLFSRKGGNTVEEQIRNRTIRSFLFFFFMIFVAWSGWKWLQHQPEKNGALQPLRKVLNKNEKVFKNVFSDNNLAGVYPKSMAAKKVRVNGNIGLRSALDRAAWRMVVIRNPGDTLFLTLADLKALPKTEIIFDFKCIEGWSQISHWGGVTFYEFAKHYHVGTKDGTDPDKMKPEQLYGYVGLMTPDSAYYVGNDMASMLHPQTILCYEMNGLPLPLNQGYPLRLIMPVKYGIKSIKRIGTVYFSDKRPRDYWGERGYDYYSGL